MAGAPPDIDDDPHGARLLAAVIEEPDEHARRLVYADWLLERGDPYGELIQLCERRFALGVQDPKLDARISLLQKPLLPRILRPLTTSHWPTIRRGFLWTVRFTAAEFAQHGEQLLARHPLHSLSIESSTKALAVLAQTPAVRRLSG